ncbi:ATP synthase F1 subunit gamma [Patulibacter sp. S7RM1-6]
MAQSDVKARIASVQNIRKITRAMEMVSASRLRRAEQRAASLRPYADAVRRMTSQAAAAAGAGELQSQPVLQTHEQEKVVGLVLVTADRGLAGAFNSQILRAGLARAEELERTGEEVRWFVTGRRGEAALNFRNKAVDGAYTGFTDAPNQSHAAEVAEALVAAYVDGHVDRVEVIYNGYVSPLVQEVRRETLLPLAAANVVDDAGEHDLAAQAEEQASGPKALVEYEPDPAEILAELVPEFVEISLLRALLESAASEHGARMTAMRSASDNAGEVIQSLTLAMNRARQADITQEIMEVVAGAEALS